MPVSPLLGSSSNMGSPNGSLPDLEGTGYRAMEEKSMKCSYKLRSCRYSYRTYPGSKIASKRFPRQWPRMMRKSRTNIEQMVSSLAARVTTLETNATFVSSGSGSARSWNILGRSDDSTATGSFRYHGPGSSDDSSNTRRGLDTFSSPEDEQARSAVLLRFPFEQYHKGITKWINNLWEESNMPAFNNLSEFIAKQVLCRSGLCLKHEPHVKTLLRDIKMMVSPLQLTVPSAAPIQKS